MTEMPTLRYTTFIAACHEFFGRMQGQTLQEFNAEIKKLTAEDREELIALFRTVGFDASKTS